MDDSSSSLVSFNFWPSFADMMLVIVFVLVLILFVVLVVITAGSVNLQQVQESQKTIIDTIALAYETKPEKEKHRDSTLGRQMDVRIIPCCAFQVGMAFDLDAADQRKFSFEHVAHRAEHRSSLRFERMPILLK